MSTHKPPRKRKQVNPSSPLSEAEIQQRAYELWRSRSVRSTAQEDWNEAKQQLEQEQANKLKGWRKLACWLNQPWLCLERRVWEPGADLVERAAIFQIIEKLSPVLEAIGVLLIPVVVWWATQSYQTQKDNQDRAVRQQEAIKSYLNQLTTVFLDGKIKEDADLQKVTRASTLALLEDPNLNGDGKGQVIGFLSELGLITTGPEDEKDALNNQQKNQSKEPLISLERADLSSANLIGADLSSAILFRADLSRTTLRNADLSSAILIFADLRSAILSSADLSRANLSRANLSRATLFTANLSSANLSSANLSSANLFSADLSRAILSRATLSRATLSRADLSSANLSSANLSSANLRDADLRDADLRDANLSSANLFSAELSRADLRDADLRDANLSSANLILADLFSADLRDTDLRDATLFSANLSSANLSSANLNRALLLSANLSTSIELNRDQLTQANPPLLCNTKLPTELKELSDRDCDRLPQILKDRYPGDFDTLEEAKKFVEEERKRQL